MSVKVKCPFCNAAVNKKHIIHDDESSYVMCGKCHCMGPPTYHGTVEEREKNSMALFSARTSAEYRKASSFDRNIEDDIQFEMEMGAELNRQIGE